MSAPALSDSTTPQAYVLPDLGPGLSAELTSKLDGALRQIASDPSVQALVLFGSRAGSAARPDFDLDQLVIERSPHLDGEAKVSAWWRHFTPLQALPLSIDLVVSGSADASRLAGSRWHEISEAARHGVVLVVNP